MEVLIIPFVAMVVLVMFADLIRTQWRILKQKRMSQGKDKRSQ